MNEASSGVQAMRRDAEAEIGQGVRTLNEQLGLISDLNKQIVHRQALGQSGNELLAARDAAVNKVSELVDVQSFTRASGDRKSVVSGKSVSVRVAPGGRRSL